MIQLDVVLSKSAEAQKGIRKKPNRILRRSLVALAKQSPTISFT